MQEQTEKSDGVSQDLRRPFELRTSDERDEFREEFLREASEKDRRVKRIDGGGCCRSFSHLESLD